MQDPHGTGIGDEEERLANLYVASWNLHSSLDLKEVVTVIFEICQNLVGSARTVFYVHDEVRDVLEAVSAIGPGGLPDAPVVPGEGRIGEVVASGAPWVNDGEGGPRVVVPFTASGRLLGAVVIEQLLQQKPAVSTLDREIFDLLGRQGGHALYGAFLAGAAERKVTADEFRARLEG